jgi:hypothetical protein
MLRNFLIEMGSRFGTAVLRFTGSLDYRIAGPSGFRPVDDVHGRLAAQFDFGFNRIESRMGAHCINIARQSNPASITSCSVRHCASINSIPASRKNPAPATCRESHSR